MKTGRNEPCPCGSGKKYKKCCLRKEAQGVTQEKPRGKMLKAPIPTDLEEEEKVFEYEDASEEQEDEASEESLAAMRLYRAFGEADDEEKLTLFHQALDEPEALDAENAFTMLSHFHGYFATRAEHARFREVVNSLREKLPDVYAAEEHYCLAWLIEDALATGAEEYLREDALALAAIVEKDVDQLFWLLERLTFHNRSALILEMVRVALPRLKEDSGKYMPSAFYDLASTACNLEVFTRLEEQPDADLKDPAFLEQLAYAEPSEEWYNWRVGFFGEDANEQAWRLEDFTLKPRKTREEWDDWDDEEWDEEDEQEGEKEPPVPTLQERMEEEPGKFKLYALSFAFLNYAHKQEGIPYLRAEMARENFVSYLLQRAAGALKERKNPFDFAAPKPKKKKKKGRYSKKAFSHVLCPDPETLERYLSNLGGVIHFKRYDLVATLQLLPSWLRFLESCALLTASERMRCLKELSKLVDPFRGQTPSGVDPTLVTVLQSWYEDAGLEEPS